MCIRDRIYLEEITTNDLTAKSQTVTYKVLVGLFDAKKYTKFEFKKLKKLKYDPKIVQIAD